MRSQLRRVHDYRDPSFVGGGEDEIERREPAGDVRGPRDREQPGPRCLVEGQLDVAHAEGPVRTALDVPARRNAPPREEVGVMLHDRADHHVARVEPEAVGEVVERLGRVAADDRYVVGAAITCEGQRGPASVFVGSGCHL